MEKSTIPEGGFTDLKSLDVGLSYLAPKKATVFAGIVASRSALRVLPLAMKRRGPIGLNLPIDMGWRFACIRANCISQTGLKNPSIVAEYNFANAANLSANAAQMAAQKFSTFGISNSPYSNVEVIAFTNSAAYAARTFLTKSNGIEISSHSIKFSASAVLIQSTIPTHHLNEFWAAVTADARMLEAGATSAEMAATPLWAADSPYKPAFDRKTFLAAAPSFEVWLDWYEPIVEGKAPWGLPRDVADSIEMRIALGDGRGEGGKDFWDRDADVVNAEIKSWVDAARAEVAERKRVEQQQDEQDLAQRPAPHQFDVADGKIVAFPMKSKRKPDDLSADMREELLAKALAARERLERTQAPKHIIEAFDRLIKGLGDSISDVRPGKLLMQSNTIEAIAASYDTAEMRNELAGDCLTLVKDISESLTDFKALFPEILDIEAMRLAQRIAGESTNPILVQTRQIAVFAAASEVIDASVLAAFDAAFAEIDEQERLAASGGNDTAIAEANKKKAETTALHALDVRNFVARVLKSRVAIGAVNAGSKLTKDVAKNTYKGALSAVEETSKASTKVALAFLISQFTGILPAIAIYMLSFAPLAKKAAEIAAGDPGKVGPQ